MRKHGWQLPAHTFQVVAITVFCLLVVAFYAFLAPFLWGRIWEYVLIGTYSPVVITVFILYVRCTAINPADPGVLFKYSHETTNGANPNLGSPAKDLPGKFSELGSRVHSSPSTGSRGSLARSDMDKVASRRENLEATAQVPNAKKSSSCIVCGPILCGLFVHEDCRKERAEDQEATGEDALFCTLCNVEKLETLPSSRTFVIFMSWSKTMPELLAGHGGGLGQQFLTPSYSSQYIFFWGGILLKKSGFNLSMHKL